MSNADIALSGLVSWGSINSYAACPDGWQRHPGTKSPYQSIAAARRAAKKRRRAKR
ncbi:hypothetical protein K3392_09675 [Escherichia coli]|nr:hypothetical protein K3392_09675 [Escherichia coli]